MDYPYYTPGIWMIHTPCMEHGLSILHIQNMDDPYSICGTWKFHILCVWIIHSPYMEYGSSISQIRNMDYPYSMYEIWIVHIPYIEYGLSMFHMDYGLSTFRMEYGLRIPYSIQMVDCPTPCDVWSTHIPLGI